MSVYNRYRKQRQAAVAEESGVGQQPPLDKIRELLIQKQTKGLNLSSSMEERRRLQKVSRFVNCEKIEGKLRAKSKLGRCGLFCAVSGSIIETKAGLKWTGYETCKSAMCPYCGTVKAKSFREELRTSVERIYERDGSVLFTTLTNSREGYGLKNLYQLQSKLLSRIFQGSFKKKLETEFGYIGHYRRPEVQIRLKHIDDGQGDFHSHNHLLMFFDKKLTPAEIQELDRLVYLRWSKSMMKHGLKAYREFSRVEAPADSRKCASYITKLAGSLSLEMSATDTKTGKGSVSYFQLLKLISLGGYTPRMLYLAKTYQDEMKGTRFMSVSLNLRRQLLPELFSPEGVEMSEEEIEKWFEKAEEEREEKAKQVRVPVVPQVIGYIAGRDGIKNKLLFFMEKNPRFLWEFNKLCSRVLLLIECSKGDRCLEEFDIQDEVRRELQLLMDTRGYCP